MPIKSPSYYILNWIYQANRKNVQATSNEFSRKPERLFVAWLIIFPKVYGYHESILTNPINPEIIKCATHWDYSAEVHPWRMKNQSMYLIHRTYVLVAVKRPLNGAWDPVVAFHIFLFSPKQTILIDVTNTLNFQVMIQFSQPGLHLFNEAKYCLVSVTIF